MTENAKSLLQKFEPKPGQVITARPQVHAARFSPWDERLFATGFDARVRCWRLGEQAEELPSIGGHHGWVQAVGFSPHQPVVYSADSWGHLQATRCAPQRHETCWLQPAAHDGWIRELAVSPDGTRLATCGRDRKVRVWSSLSGDLAQTLEGHDHDVYCVRFDPSGEFLVSGDDRGVVKQWSLAEGKCVREFDAGALHLYHRLQDVGGARVLAFDAAGQTLACGGTIPKNGGTVQGKPAVLLFDFAGGESIRTLELGEPKDCFVHDLQYHPAGFWMAVTSGTPGQGQLVFQRPDDEEPFYTDTRLSNCHSLSLRDDGQLAVAATNRNSNGNGRRLNQDGEYEGNESPIQLFQLPTA